ncbi:IS66 family transposase, partial [Candidatus Magnetobacterium casense]
QLHEFGVDISSGQLSRILVEGHDNFHKEKEDILTTGLEISYYINVDDTGARHDGQNGVCTHVGNELFAWFKSTESKSRINFLELLRGSQNDYHINEDALAYMEAQKLPKAKLQILKEDSLKIFIAKEQWEKHLQKVGITQQHHIRIATEGALVGSVLENGFNPDMAIVSDDAGQFNVFLHALCWVHAERTINKIVPFANNQRLALDESRKKIWDLYADLKEYKNHPVHEKKVEIDSRFERIFQDKTCFMTLNLALKRLYKNKAELLLVLDRPDIPLYNNTSERDIREYVKRRKISGGTRSDLGRKCRDTFISLKKTCRNLAVSSWHYINDRVSKNNTITQLDAIMRQKAVTSTF